MQNILTKIKKHHIISRFLVMTISLLISALVYNIFLLPTKIVTGGISGLTTIINYIYGFSPAIIILLLNIVFLILSFMYLGLERTIGSIAFSFLYPLFIALTAIFTKNITIDTSDLFIIAIFIGVIGGFANGLMYKTGFSAGGLPIVSQILYKYYKIPISKSNLIINIVVVILGGAFFGTTMIMYAIIILYINSIIIDKVLLGISNNKAFYIITTEEKEIKEYIINSLGHSVTVFDVKGAFLEKKRKALLTVIPSREYFRVKEGIELIDKQAFFVVTDAYEVAGGK